jgi:hypothetical protein
MLNRTLLALIGCFDGRYAVPSTITHSVAVFAIGFRQMKQMKSYSLLCAPLILSLTLISCSEVEDAWEVRVMTPRSSRIIISDSVTSARAWFPKYLYHANQRFFVSDHVTHGVLVLAEDGTLLDRIGLGQGRGPGELLGPTVVRVGSDSTIYILDPPQGAVMRFSSRGDYLGKVQLPVGAFGLLPDGRKLVPAGLTPGLLIGRDGEFTSLPSTLNHDEQLPAGAIAVGWLIDSDREGDVLFVNNFDGRAWQLTTGSSFWGMQEVELPAQIRSFAKQKNQGRVDALGMRGQRPPIIPLFRDLQYDSHGRVWLTTAWREMIGARIDFRTRSILAIIPSPEEEHAHLRGAVLLSDTSLVALYDEDLRLFSLAPAEVPEWLQ